MPGTRSTRQASCLVKDNRKSEDLRQARGVHNYFREIASRLRSRYAAFDRRLNSEFLDQIGGRLFLEESSGHGDRHDRHTFSLNLIMMMMIITVTMDTVSSR